MNPTSPLTRITEWIAEQRAIEQKATPGPFVVDEYDEEIPSSFAIRQHDLCSYAGGFWVAKMFGDLPDDLGSEEANAIAFAASRTSLPKALAALEVALYALNQMSCSLTLDKIALTLCGKEGGEGE